MPIDHPNERTMLYGNATIVFIKARLEETKARYYFQGLIDLYKVWADRGHMPLIPNKETPNVLIRTMPMLAMGFLSGFGLIRPDVAGGVAALSALGIFKSTAVDACNRQVMHIKNEIQRLLEELDIKTPQHYSRYLGCFLEYARQAAAQEDVYNLILVYELLLEMKTMSCSKDGWFSQRYQYFTESITSDIQPLTEQLRIMVENMSHMREPVPYTM